MRLQPLLLLPFLLLISSVSSAEIIMTSPIGVNKITCLANSDTIVGIPFRKEGSRSTVTSGDPIAVSGQADLREIPLSASTLGAGSLNQHYLHFTSGTRDGRWYDITANTTTSVTIDLNGDDLTGVVIGDSVTITEYWTLDTLFPPAQATTGWTEDPQNAGVWLPNGNAIVASAGTRAFQRRTELLFPNIEGSGINRSSLVSYYVYNNQWQEVNGDGSDTGNVVIYPDMILTIRQPSTISHPTWYRSSGEVLTTSFSTPLHTQTDVRRDTFVGLPRPIDLTLGELNLWESGAFAQSLGTRAFERRDELLIFDNSNAAINKSSSTTYFHNGTNWLAVGDNTTNRDTDIIPAGAGFIIRKYQTTGGETAFWNNIAPY